LRLAQAAEFYGRPDRSIANNRYAESLLAFNQQRIVAVLISLAAYVQNDPPALAPVAVDGVNHNGLMACDRLSPGAANVTEKRLRGQFALVRLGDLCKCRTDQMQNNPDNRQSHKQFDQAETLLMHDIFLPEMSWPVRSVHGMAEQPRRGGGMF
jgi:hypothetical protein